MQEENLAPFSLVEVIRCWVKDFPSIPWTCKKITVLHLSRTLSSLLCIVVSLPRIQAFIFDGRIILGLSELERIGFYVYCIGQSSKYEPWQSNTPWAPRICEIFFVLVVYTNLQQHSTGFIGVCVAWMRRGFTKARRKNSKKLRVFMTPNVGHHRLVFPQPAAALQCAAGM